MTTRFPHLDAAESIFFQRQLESIDPRVYEVQFAGLKARQLLPSVDGVSEVDNVYTYRMYKTTGEAKIIADDADDLPDVNAFGEEKSSLIKTVGDKFQYGLQEIRAAAAKNAPLSTMGMVAARRAIEEKIDSMLAFGVDGTLGFINSSTAVGGPVNSTTFVVSPKSGVDTWLDSGAAHATGAEMVNDCNALIAETWAALKAAPGLGGPLTLVLPTPEYAYMANTPMGTGDGGLTALKFLLNNNPFLAGVEFWDKLSGAGLSTANRMICYLKDPMVLGAVVPMEFQPQAPQLTGLRYQIPCIARCGGTVFRYPVACRYGDGI